MPLPELSHRRQHALLWRATAYSDNYGEHKVVATYVHLQVRWDDNETQMTSPNGDSITVDATAVVDRDIPMGSIMWLGSDQDLARALATSVRITNVPTSNLMVVKALKRTPDINGRATMRTVGMESFKSSMPNT